MKPIGLSATQAHTPKGRPNNRLTTKTMGHTHAGRSSTNVTGLKAQSLGHKPAGRNAATVTKLRAPKTMGTV